MRHALELNRLSPCRLPQGLHQQLLDIYCQSGALQPSQLQDDGYILNSLGHHLFWAGRLDELQALLVDPCWLEQKLQGYGVAAVVADYRRWAAAGCPVAPLAACCWTRPCSNLLHSCGLGRGQWQQVSPSVLHAS